VKLSGLILAAGMSRRMGSPKALLPYDGETFLDRLIGAFAVHCRQVVVVVREGLPLPVRRADQARFVVNPEPERGQLSSLQRGLRECGGGAVMYSPVDYGHVRAETIALLAGHAGSPELIVPRFEGRHGHPIVASAMVVSELLALDADATARDVIHRHCEATYYLDVDDAGVVRDVDDPSDYRAVLEGTAQ
jgi:molybdenum cofactor cytidylyltransferase